jgi:hypothetical protein
MEEWLDPAPPHVAELCALVRQHRFDHFCAMVSQSAENEESPRKAFAELYAFVACLWHGMRDEQPLVRPLVRLYYDLEHGVSPDGNPLEPMVPDLDAAEHARRLALLDAGRARFKALLLTGLPLLPGVGVRNLVIRWARLQYDCVHRFQAPPRTDPQLAMRDAMGLSDHFAELMTQVLDVVDPEREK